MNNKIQTVIADTSKFLHHYFLNNCPQKHFSIYKGRLGTSLLPDTNDPVYIQNITVSVPNSLNTPDFLTELTNYYTENFPKSIDDTLLAIDLVFTEVPYV